jgi:hypothetical protein
MKKYLYVFLTLCCLAQVKAQDQLFKKDNTKILVKITEIGPEEVKYKLYSNPTGPTYVESKRDISLIIFENGQHEVITTGPEQMSQKPEQAVYSSRPNYRSNYKLDSLAYFKYSENISLNFFSFLNMELGLIYQKDFFKKSFGVVVPIAIGIEKPALTDAVYNNTFNGYRSLSLNRKLFEVGLGLNYYPSLKTAVNYYIGPAIRYMQYDATVNYQYRDYTSSSYSFRTISKNTTVTRYTMSITNGFIFRTRSRLVLNLFGSIGFKNDFVSTKLVDPNTNVTIEPISTPFNLYFWSGFSIGFGF